MTTAQEWMTPDVRACRPDSDLGEAARLMWEHDCGALPVIDGGGKLVGMVTDRDVAMASFLQGRAPSALSVSSCMASRPHACRPSDSIEQVIRAMADHQVRRIPIVDDGGDVKGILSLNDLLRRAMTLVDADERSRLTAVLLEAMASVSEPHRVVGAVPENLPQPLPAAAELRPEPRRQTGGKARSGGRRSGEELDRAPGST